MFKNSDKNDSDLAIELQYLLLQLLFILFCFVSSLQVFLGLFQCFVINLTNIFLDNECVVLRLLLCKRVAKCGYLLLLARRIDNYQLALFFQAILVSRLDSYQLTLACLCLRLTSLILIVVTTKISQVGFATGPGGRRVVAVVRERR